MVKSLNLLNTDLLAPETMETIFKRKANRYYE